MPVACLEQALARAGRLAGHTAAAHLDGGNGACIARPARIPLTALALPRVALAEGAQAVEDGRAVALWGDGTSAERAGLERVDGLEPLAEVPWAVAVKDANSAAGQQ